METRNGKTIIWIPREAFDSVQRFWKPEFTWIPVPVDSSLPPDHIAYIETNGPVSPLPPLPAPPRTPLSQLPPLLTPVTAAPRTPAALLPPLDTGSLRGGAAAGYFEGSPELETAVTAGLFSPDDSSDTTATPSTATETGSPPTPGEYAGRRAGAHDPKIWRQSGPQPRGDDDVHLADDDDAAPPEIAVTLAQPALSKAGRPPPNHASRPWKMLPDDMGDGQWKMADRREDYRPAHAGLQPPSWKRQSGRRAVERKDHWRTLKRDEAHWTGSKKGFAVRVDVHLEMEVEIKGFVDGDITLSAEALYAL